MGVWLYALRAWKDDDSADLATTMAALDKALDQAARVSDWLGGQATGAASDSPADDAMEGVVDVPETEPPDADAIADHLVVSNPPPPPAPEPPG